MGAAARYRCRGVANSRRPAGKACSHSNQAGSPHGRSAAGDEPRPQAQLEYYRGTRGFRRRLSDDARRFAGFLFILATHRDTVRKFARALVEGIHIYKTQKEFSKEVIAKYVKTDDAEALEDSYQFFSRLVPAKPLPFR